MAKSYIVMISEILPHPGADRLELAKMSDMQWVCVTGKGTLKVGDYAVYFETDSILPESIINGALKDSKISLPGGRLRAVRIRGVVSEGLLLSTKSLGLLTTLEKGKDLDDVLGVTKYDPPEESIPQQHNPKQKKHGFKHGELVRYIDTVRYERCPPGFFQPDEIVHVSAKLHGTSCRMGFVKKHYKSWFMRLFKKIVFFFTQKEDLVFVAGSRNMDFPSNALYMNAATKYAIESKLAKNEILFGEIIGSGIQGGYNYGYKKGVYGFFAYALKRDDKFVDYGEFVLWCEATKTPRVPLVFTGPWSKVEPKIPEILQDRSSIEQDIPCREGVVIGSVTEQYNHVTGARKLVKILNPIYLLNKNNTDNH